jgi:LiaI-LiaF-like transmembrane region
MNRYILIRRLTGPSILLLLGVIALLHQADLVSWDLFWPLLLILIGLLKLAQRAALAAAGDEPYYPGNYPGGSPYGSGMPPAPQPPGSQPIPQGTGSSIVPSQKGFGQGPNGGQ